MDVKSLRKSQIDIYTIVKFDRKIIFTSSVTVGTI